MAQLKDTTVNGGLRATESVASPIGQFDTIYAKEEVSTGITENYTSGEDKKILQSGTFDDKKTTYWASLSPKIQITQGTGTEGPTIGVTVAGVTSNLNYDENNNPIAITKATTNIYGVTKLTGLYNASTPNGNLAVTGEAIKAAVDTLNSNIPDSSNPNLEIAGANKTLTALSIQSGKISAATFTEIAIDSSQITSGIDRNTILYGDSTGVIQSAAPAWGNWDNGTTAGPQAKIQIGAITYTSPAIPAASTSISGIVTTEAQSFIGNKSFYSIVDFKADSGEGGEIHLNASDENTSQAGIVLDVRESKFRIFGIASADGETINGAGTPLVIDPYNKTITGGYTLTGSLTGHASLDLPLTGGTMTGSIHFSKDSPLIFNYTAGTETPVLVLNNAPNYGIRYTEGTPDTMKFSASGNANTNDADLCINGAGDGTVTIRGNTILHTGNWRQIIFTNKNRSLSTLTVGDSAWAIVPSGATDVFGLSFKDTALSTDTGDWRMWLEQSGTAATLNMRIDGNIQATTFIGALSGNASTATRINGNLGQISSGTNCNIWVSSTSSADGIPKYVTGVYVHASTGRMYAKEFRTSHGYINGSATNGGINMILTGDDAWIGDCNIAGTVGIKANSGAAAGVGFYGADGTNRGRIYYDANGGHSTTTFEATGYLKSTANSNTITIGSQNTSWTHIYSSANIPFIFNNRVCTTTGGLGNSSYPWSDLWLKGPIYYQGTAGGYTPISFKDSGDQYGLGVIVGAGGLTCVGGGESADTVAAQFSSGGSENLCLSNDGAIDFYTNCQNGFSSAVHTTIDISGNFSGNAANVTGTVGIAHGGTGATTVAKARQALFGEGMANDTEFFITINTNWVKGGYITNAKAAEIIRNNASGSWGITAANVPWTGITGKHFYHTDTTSDWASYPWHQVASATITGNYQDFTMSVLVTCGSDATKSGILNVRLRSNGSAAFESQQIHWTTIKNINNDDFWLCYTTSTKTAVLWCRIDNQYNGYKFTVLENGNRYNGQVNSWTMKASVSGHGSAAYSGNTNSRSTNSFEIGANTTDHATALANYFNSYKGVIPRNTLTHYYSSTSGNGSVYMGYFLQGYDTAPYGGFFVAHYTNPFYVGISNGTYTQQHILTSTNYTTYTVTKTGSGASGTWGISVTGNAANVTGTVGITNGGTGATAPQEARQNLGFRAGAYTFGKFTAAGSTQTATITFSGTMNRVVTAVTATIRDDSLNKAKAMWVTTSNFNYNTTTKVGTFNLHLHSTITTITNTIVTWIAME